MFLPLARILADEVKESEEFGAMLFYIGFVSQHVTLCQFETGNLRFCFVPLIDAVQNCEKPMAIHAEYLLVAATHAKSFLKPQKKETVQRASEFFE